MRYAIDDDKCMVIYGDVAAIYFVEVRRDLLGAVSPSRSPTCLPVPRIDDGIFDRRLDVKKWVAVGRDFYSQSILNPSLGVLSFTLRIVV